MFRSWRNPWTGSIVSHWIKSVDSCMKRLHSMHSWCTELFFRVANSDLEWRINRGTSEGLGETLLWRRLEWRLLTWNVYYSNHSDKRKSSLLWIRTIVKVTTSRAISWQGLSRLSLSSAYLWIQTTIHTYVSFITVLICSQVVLRSIWFK